MPRRHSGFVIVVCADWRNRIHLKEQLEANEETSAILLEEMLSVIRSSRPFDPAALTDWAERAEQVLTLLRGRGSSRINMLVRRVLEDPRNSERILPHVISIEAPAHVVGHRADQLALIAQNETVLGGAHTVFIDGHSDCAGIASRYEGRYGRDQFHFQAGFMEAGGQDLANFLADNSGQDTMVHLAYTVLDESAHVSEVRELLTVTAAARQP